MKPKAQMSSAKNIDPDDLKALVEHALKSQTQEKTFLVKMLKVVDLLAWQVHPVEKVFEEDRFKRLWIEEILIPSVG